MPRNYREAIMAAAMPPHSLAEPRYGRIPYACVIPVLAGNGGKTAWAGLPGKPIVGADGVAKRDATTGKLRYSPVLEWSDKHVADRFSAAVVEAVEQAHPGVVRP